MQYAVSHAKRFEKRGKQSAADALCGTAKTIAFNLGANLWPGWNDKRITITKTDLAVGLDAAKTNLRLGLELKRDDAVLSNAYWLIGAHHLAGKKYQAARKAFEQAAAKSRFAGKPESVLMNDGYVALVRLLEKPDDRQRRESFEHAIRKLEKLQSKNGNYFAAQLRTAKSVFTK